MLFALNRDYMFVVLFVDKAYFKPSDRVLGTRTIERKFQCVFLTHLSLSSSTCSLSALSRYGSSSPACLWSLKRYLAIPNILYGRLPICLRAELIKRNRNIHRVVVKSIVLNCC